MLWLSTPAIVTATSNLASAPSLSPTNIANIEHCLMLVRSWKGDVAFEAERQSVIDTLMEILDPGYDNGVRLVVD